VEPHAGIYTKNGWTAPFLTAPKGATSNLALRASALALFITSRYREKCR
jgi:hypothetical protein